MKAIELFAGIGGFRIAVEMNGIDTVWANDVSVKACAVYRDRFGPGSIVEGDVRELLDQLPKHDVLTGGFPCQPFSAAGKKEGVRDPRGTLFEVIVEVLRTRRPKYFVLENVKRLLTMENGFHFATILASLSELDYQIEWRLLNAMDLGLPQNRQRVFIIGTKQMREPVVRLAAERELRKVSVVDRERLCDRSSWKRIEKHGRRFPDWGLASSGSFCGADVEFLSKRSVVPLKNVLEADPPEEFDFTETTLKRMTQNTPVNRFVQGVQILSNQGGGARMGYTIFGTDGVAPTLTSAASRHYERYRVGDRYRRLTNKEYARIQGFPDEHCRAVSVYDQYALFGNAVPPPMASWVIERMLEAGHVFVEPKHKRQPSLFDLAV